MNTRVKKIILICKIKMLIFLCNVPIIEQKSPAVDVSYIWYVKSFSMQISLKLLWLSQLVIKMIQFCDIVNFILFHFSFLFDNIPLLPAVKGSDSILLGKPCRRVNCYSHEQ